MDFCTTIICGFSRERGRKKACGHGRHGGEKAWRQHARRHIDDWEAEGRAAKQIRRTPIAVDANEALAEAHAEIRDRETMAMLASQKVVAASYDLYGGLRVYRERAMPRVIIAAASTPATSVPQVKRRHRGERKHRNNRQCFATAA